MAGASNKHYLLNCWRSTRERILRIVCRRGVAQPGSAPQWGCGGREFESRRPDQSDIPLAGARSAQTRASPQSLLGLLLIMGALAACTESGDPRHAFDGGDFRKSYRLAKNAATAGDPKAMNLLGVHYYLGVGVRRDFASARRWFESAARNNNADAQCNLAILYLRGLGGAQDFMWAYAWFDRAVASGNTRAQSYMATMGDALTPNQIAKGRLSLQKLLTR